MSGNNESNDEEFDAEYFEDDDELFDEELQREEPQKDSKIVPTPPARIASLLADPWPKTVLFVTIIGFIIVLFTPYDIWSIWNWTLVAMYGLITINIIVSPFSLRIWYEGEGWLRYVGIGNFVIMNGTVIVGTLDTLLWVSLGSGLISGFESGTVLMVCFVIITFLAYSLYFSWKFLTGEART